MEPVMCPFCGGTDLIEEEENELETDEEYLVIYQWSCADCHETFNKVVRSSAEEEDFEEEVEEEEGPLWS